MDEKLFIKNFADQFDERDSSTLSLGTKFRELNDWSSLIALSVMAMCAEEYNVILSADEMEKANTIFDIYDIVKSRNNG